MSLMKTMYKERMWSELEVVEKEKLIEEVKNNLVASGIPIPSDKTIEKRVKMYYSNKRNTELINADPEKKDKRRMDVKRNRMTYVG